MSAASDVLSAAVREAIRTDLGGLEAYHRRRVEELRDVGRTADADAQEALANAVRAAMVAAQVAAGRAVEAAGVFVGAA